VDVGLEYVGDPQPVLLGQVQQPVDVTLRVDHDSDRAVRGQVTPVPEARRV
jgi:hypothetical protein